MPELPEVQTVVNTLRPRVLGQRIDAINLARTDIVHPKNVKLASLLAGESIASIDRRGKRIVVTLTSRNRFYFHLGMSGRLTVEPPAAPKLPHTHLILEISGIQLRFRDPRRFGGVFWLGTTPDDPDKMGPEPLDLRASDLSARLAGTSRAVKNALLDQSVVAGLGNIYVDESLFQAGIHPLRRACDLTKSDITRLNRSIKSVLNRALRHRGSTLRDYIDADGNEGAFQKLHRVYAREAQPCNSCKSPISRIILGGRSTHFCPVCQPSPNAKAM